MVVWTDNILYTGSSPPMFRTWGESRTLSGRIRKDEKSMAVMGADPAWTSHRTDFQEKWRLKKRKRRKRLSYLASHPPLCLWPSLRLTFAQLFIIIFYVAHDVRAWDKPVLHICSAQRTFVARRDHLSSVSTYVIRLVFGSSLFSGQAILVVFGESLQANAREKKENRI